MVLEEEIRKGPWTEHEDVQLVFYVNMFGDRRWDFIAKVSGLKRTGKSCRLRWVNYLHPGLKRGKMTPHEERLVLELHNKWGNRWSRIARKLPGRTDNEIKNYWRTHMRKKAQERKKGIASSSSISANSSVCSTTSSSSTMNTAIPPGGKILNTEADDPSFYDTGGLEMLIGGMQEKAEKEVAQDKEKGYSMDDIWREIDEEYSEEGGCNLSSQTVNSTIWDYCYPDIQWMIDEEESKMMFPANLTG